MSYVALYRKYRPQNFDEIVGQKAIVTTLKNQIKTGKVGHAYLFCGMRGTGKTSTARVLAKALNCEKGPTEHPCNVCSSCQAINDGNMMDVIEMDAASNRGIDDIRELREKVNFAPSEGGYKIYIIDEVHMLTTEAFNALLKTLEEPPGYVVFILATTEPNKLPPTILSRCMRFDFGRVSTPEIVERLKEIVGDLNLEADEKALVQIAAYSQGSMRDSLSLLDKALAFGGSRLSYQDVLTLMGAVSRQVFYDISQAAIQKDSGTMLDILDDVVSQGKDLFRFVDDLLVHFRNLLMVCIDANRDLIDVIDEEYIKLQEIAQEYTKAKLLTVIDILSNAANDVKWSSKPRIVIESALVKLTLPTLWEGQEGYISRIQELEGQISRLEEHMGNISSDNLPKAIPNKSLLPPDNLSQSKVSKKPVEPKAEVIKEEKTTEDDKEVFEKIKKAWPEVVNTLNDKGKIMAYTLIKTGHIRPVYLDNKKLYLTNDGDAVFEEKIEKEKHIIEEIIKDISGVDIGIKGFLQPKETDKKKATLSSKVDTNSKANDPADILSKKAIDFFGKEVVTFEE